MVLLVLSEEENREEIGTKLRNMEDIVKLKQPTRLAIYKGNKTNRTFTT